MRPYYYIDTPEVALDVKNTDLIEDQRTRVALYVRVSLDRREKASVEEQLADLRLTVDRLGWDIVAELADNDVPASRYSKADRPKDRKSTRLNSSHVRISYAVFCLK